MKHFYRPLKCSLLTLVIYFKYKHFWIITFLIVGFLAMGQDKPNILVILTDDQGWGDIGYNNPKVYTPNMDALAAEGAKFSQHYVMPQCTPSRVALMTGRYPSRFGNSALQATNNQVIPLGTTTMASMLKNNGYETYTAGKWHMGSSFAFGPNNFGFDYSYGSTTGAVGMYDHRYRQGNTYEFNWHRDLNIINGYENGEHVTDLVTDDAISFIENRNSTSPFFMYMAYHAVHTPLDERGQFVDVPTQLDPNNPNRWLNEDDIEWFNDPAGKIQSEPDPEKRLLLACAYHLDFAIGQLIDTLKAEGLYDNTVILFSSDNGPQVNWGGNAYPDDLNLTNFNQPIPFRASKTHTYEGGIRVPGFMVWPGKIAPKTVEDPVHIIDWFPTIKAIVEDTSSNNIDFDGTDLSDLVVSNIPLPERTLYWRWGNGSRRWAIRKGDDKIVSYYGNSGGIPSAANDWELYDLENDGSENNDIASQQTAKLDELHAAYLQVRQNDFDFEPVAEGDTGTPGGGPSISGCEIDLSIAPIESISSQGTALGTIDSGDLGITINGNGWNAIEIPQNISADTVLEFEFASSEQGEQHAIGFSNTIGTPNAVRGTRFNVFGTQSVEAANANSDFAYNGNGNFQSFSIPVGSFFTGSFQYIVFVNDNDAALGSGNSSFRNLRLVDSAGNCLSNGTTSNGGNGTPITPNVPTNVALNKPAQQSTTGFGGVPSRAVDGDTNGLYSDGSVTATASLSEANPWWRVDLEANYSITEIRVYNRVGCCEDRLNDVNVYIGNTESTDPNDYTFIGTLNSDTINTLPNLNVSGRYVFIQHGGTNILSLAEVEVISGPQGTSGGGAPTSCDIDLSSAPIELVTSQGTIIGAINSGDLGITINGNGWNALEIPQNITPNTILEFEFASSEQGEEHAIGFASSITSPSAVNGTRFKLFGTQNIPTVNANSSFAYNGGGNFQSFSIPVGTFFTGDFQYLVFVNDNDAAPGAGNSSFRNIRIVDAAGNCGNTTGSDVTNTNPPSINYVFNFATESTETPTGFTEDTGAPYGPKAGGLTYGWVLASDNSPFDISAQARNRAPNPDADPIRESFIHMDHPSLAPAVKWEIALPNGTYRVVLQGGDVEAERAAGTQHLIKAEGVTVIDHSSANGTFGTRTGVAEVTVTDGKLTLDGIGGSNAKLVAVAIQSADGLRFPAIVDALPADGVTNVVLNTIISANSLSLPNTNAAGLNSLENATINNSTVQLFKVDGNTTTPIALTLNGTGGGDAINLTFNGLLEPNTKYRYSINGVEDVSGAPIFPYSAEFITGTDVNTGTGNAGNLDDVSFTNEGSVATGRYTSLVVGPDGKLYGLRITGQIDRWTMNTDGSLTGQETITALNDAFGGDSRLAIGLAFAPNSTPTNPVAYVTHSSFVFQGGPEWDGRMSRLTGANLNNHELVLTHLPRSIRDHLSNSIVFDPNNPNILYFNQGSNSAGGEADGAWGNRPERLLSAATLKLDLSLLPNNLPLNVQTTSTLSVINSAPSSSIVMSDGTYNPYATNAPLTIVGSGIRNPYDLVFHSNGQIYVPTNGTAGGSNSPASVAGTRRPNGDFYNGPSIPRVTGNDKQRDFLFRINPNDPNIGYFGHPNPLRGEYVLNSGSPSTSKYPAGIVPDSNYSGFAFDFEFNISPNGVIEYKSPGALQGAMLVCRYSNGDDLIVLVPDGPNGDVTTSKIGIPGFSGFRNPLELVEDPNTGNIYVSEYGGAGSITLLKVENSGGTSSGGGPGLLSFSHEELIFEGIINEAVAGQNITIVNNNPDALVVSDLNIQGGDSNRFTVSGLPLPFTLVAGGALTIGVNYTTGAIAGDFSSNLSITLDNGNTQTIGLYGLSKNGFAGNGEPTLQQIVNTIGYPIDVGGDVLRLPTSGAAIGDEILTSTFVQANPATPITLQMVGRYSPIESATFGYYTAGNANDLTELLTVTNDRPNSQTLFPAFTGSTSFNIAGTFGFYGTRRGNENFYTEDNFNVNTGVAHAWRIYPLVDRNGTAIPNAYMFALEEATNGDYQDYVYVIFNIQPEDTPTDNNMDTGIDVTFVTPANNDVFLQGEDFGVEVSATDSNGTISNVQLFLDDVLVRQENIVPYTWSDAGQPDDFSTLTLGEHQLKAIATDNQGNTEETIIVIDIISASTTLKTVVKPDENPDKNIDAIIVFPNPTSGTVFLDLSSSASEDQVQILLYDATGRLLFKEKTNDKEFSVDLRAFQNGIYYLNVIQKDSSITRPILLKK